MSGLRGLLLAVRFLLELCLIASFAYWGLHLDAGLPTRLAAGVGAAGLAIVVWGRWVAPKASRQLDDPARFFVETLLFAAAAVGLAHAGQWTLGIVVILVYLIDRVALVVTGGTGA